MQSESILKQGTPIADKGNSRSKKTTLLIWVHGMAFLLGCALLVLVVYWLGYRAIGESLSRIGWGFLPIIALNVTRHFLRASSMYLAFPAQHRTFKYWSAVAARFGGEAVSFLTFTGPFLGDATKALLLKKDVSLTEGASAVLIDNALYYLSVVLMILSGVATFAFYFETSGNGMRGIMWAVVAISITAVVALAAAIRFRVTPLSAMIAGLGKRGLAPGFLLRIQPEIHNVETNVVQFYYHRRRDFFALFGISSITHVISVCEVYLALRLLGFEAFLSTAFIIESLTKVVNGVFGFVPGTVGIYEGGSSIILVSLGYSAVVGVTLALVRRVAIIFSLFVGMMVLLWRAVDRGTKTLIGPSE